MTRRVLSKKCAALLVVCGGLLVGCPLRPYLARNAPPVTVVIGADCKPIGQDPVWIWYGDPDLSSEVEWQFLIDPQWRAEIKGKPKEYYTAKRGYALEADAGMAAGLLPDPTIDKGEKSKKSGKAKKPRKVKINGKSGTYWPVWAYEVIIWDETSSQTRQVCKTPDPGVCIRGGSGACEI